MSMKQYLRLKMQAAKDRFSKDDEEKPRIDGNLPLNLRMGSRLQFSDTPFLLAGENSHVRHPGDETLLTAFSQVKLAGMSTYRLYLDDRDDPERSAMLMLIMDDKSDEVAERFIFNEQYEIPLYHVSLDDVPEHEDETAAVDFWIGKEQGILGMPMFHTPDELNYDRQWEPERDIWLKPASHAEQINLDAFGESTTDVDHLGTMLFARAFEGLGNVEIVEYLLPTVERDTEGFRVRIWVGLPIGDTDMDLPDAI